jgi:hypothetical protein
MAQGTGGFLTMAFGSVNNLLQLTMALSGNQGGWKEKVFMPAGNIPSALSNAALIRDYRLALIPGIEVMLTARISTIGRPPDGFLVSGNYPLDGTFPGVDNAGTPFPDSIEWNDDDDCVEVRTETDDGNWANHYVHCVPDRFVESGKLTSPITIATTAPPAIGAGGFSVDWFVRFGYYLYILKQYTVMGRVRQSGGVTTLFSSAINAIYAPKKGNHKVGAPFGQPRGRVLSR